MRLLNPLAVFVVAILATQIGTNAEDGQIAQDQYSIGHGQHCKPNGINGFDQYRRSPDLGAPQSAGYGFKHYSIPFHNYTVWHRPKAATLTKYQRCAEEPFRPRGFGNLFARPCDSFRMEYTPYVISDSNSPYGPAYILRRPDPRCDKCGTCSKH